MGRPSSNVKNKDTDISSKYCQVKFPNMCRSQSQKKNLHVLPEANLQVSISYLPCLKPCSLEVLKIQMKFVIFEEQRK
ncbi:hypothetical protein Tco_1084063 [Tanacetum coccineum]